MTLTRYSEKYLLQKALDNEWTGKGTTEDPYIIENKHPFPPQSIIKDTAIHINIKNCTFEILTLNRCKNIRFYACTFEVLELRKCSDILIGNCSFKVKLDLTRSRKVQTSDSLIPLLFLFLCYENHFKKCAISRVHNHFSRGNTFEQTETPIKNFDTILSLNPWKFYSRFLGYAAVGIVSLISAIVLFSSRYSGMLFWSLIGGIVLLSLATLTGAITILVDQKRMQKFPPNIIS